MSASPNNFTYTYGRNGNGAIVNVLRSDGVMLDSTDPDFQAWYALQTVVVPTPVTPALVPGQTTAQQAAEAAVQSFVPPSTSDIGTRVAAIEAWIVAFKATGIA